MIHTLVLPGLYDSGPEHWQSHWERDDPAGVRRVVQRDWDTPRCSDWVATLDEAIAQVDAPVVLAAHSSSCALVAHWARGASAAQRARVKGALLVAPSDPEAPSYPAGPTGFAPMPREPLPFPGIVVASTDDEYVSLDRARDFADAWRARFVDAGPLGHINSTSGLGSWPLGRTLLAELRTWPAYALRLRAVVDRAERRLLAIDDAASARRPAPG